MAYDRIDLAAGHEAAHAIMRRIVGLTATELTVDDEGNGFCAGSGEIVDYSRLSLVTLAGLVWEAGFMITSKLDLDKEVNFDDLRCVRSHIRQTGMPNQILQVFVQRTADLLLPYCIEIEELGGILAQERKLTAEQVAEFMRERGIETNQRFLSGSCEPGDKTVNTCPPDLTDKHS